MKIFTFCLFVPAERIIYNQEKEKAYFSQLVAK